MATKIIKVNEYTDAAALKNCISELDSSDTSVEIVIKLDKTVAYDLALMSQKEYTPCEHFDNKHTNYLPIRFERGEEGLVYEVEERNGLIPWAELPKEFPVNDDEIIKNKAKWLPVILGFTSKKGHTKFCLEGVREALSGLPATVESVHWKVSDLRWNHYRKLGALVSGLPASVTCVNFNDNFSAIFDQDPERVISELPTTVTHVVMGSNNFNKIPEGNLYSGFIAFPSGVRRVDFPSNNFLEHECLCEVLSAFSKTDVIHIDLRKNIWELIDVDTYAFLKAFSELFILVTIDRISFSSALRDHPYLFRMGIATRNNDRDDTVTFLPAALRGVLFAATKIGPRIKKAEIDQEPEIDQKPERRDYSREIFSWILEHFDDAEYAKHKQEFAQALASSREIESSRPVLFNIIFEYGNLDLAREIVEELPKNPEMRKEILLRNPEVPEIIFTRLFLIEKKNQSQEKSKDLWKFACDLMESMNYKFDFSNENDNDFKKHEVVNFILTCYRNDPLADLDPGPDPGFFTMFLENYCSLRLLEVLRENMITNPDLNERAPVRVLLDNLIKKQQPVYKSTSSEFFFASGDGNAKEVMEKKGSMGPDGEDNGYTPPGL